MVTVDIVEGPIDEERARTAVARPQNGAVLVFHGVVRDHHEGRAVSHIDYQSYTEMARLELSKVAEETAARHEIVDLAVIHRIGRVNVGETSLLVAVGSHHRQPAFAAGQALVDELKHRLPIWKKEYGPDGSHWVQGLRPESPGTREGRS